MVRFSEINSESKSGPHPDYHSNLVYAENFCKSAGMLPEGVRCKVSGSQWLEKALLIISWQSPKDAKIGNCANAVNLHQGSNSFQKQAQETLESVKKTAKRFLPTQDGQKDQQLGFEALKA